MFRSWRMKKFTQRIQEQENKQTGRGSEQYQQPRISYQQKCFLRETSSPEGMRHPRMLADKKITLVFV